MNRMIENELVVYSKPSCVQCNATYRALDKASRVAPVATAGGRPAIAATSIRGSTSSKGIPYRVVDLSQDDAALEYVKDLGYSQAPVVVVDDQDHWSGFNPGEIDRIAAHLAA